MRVVYFTPLINIKVDLRQRHRDDADERVAESDAEAERVTVRIYEGREHPLL